MHEADDDFVAVCARGDAVAAPADARGAEEVAALLTGARRRGRILRFQARTDQHRPERDRVAPDPWPRLGSNGRVAKPNVERFRGCGPVSRSCCRRACRSVDAARQPTWTPRRQGGATPDQCSYIVEEAGAVGAQVVIDKLARKVGLAPRRLLRPLVGPGITPHVSVETVHNSSMCEPQALRAWGCQAATLRARLYVVARDNGPPNRGVCGELPQRARTYRGGRASPARKSHLNS
jgi:hypothetical protein